MFNLLKHHDLTLLFSRLLSFLLDFVATNMRSLNARGPFLKDNNQITGPCPSLLNIKQSVLHLSNNDKSHKTSKTLQSFFFLKKSKNV